MALAAYPCILPEQRRLMLLQTHSNCYAEIHNILNAPPFTSDGAMSLLERVKRARSSLLTFASETTHNRMLRALDLASDPILSRSNLSTEDSTFDEFVVAFRHMLQTDQTTPLLDSNKGNRIARKFSYLALETESFNHLLLYQATKATLSAAFSFFSTPLTTLLEVSSTLFPEETTFALPPKTFHFFAHKLKKTSYVHLPQRFPQGCFSRIKAYTVGKESFVLKSTDSSELSHEEQINRDRQLKIEACVYMAFTHTRHPNILTLKGYSSKGLHLEIGQCDFFTFLRSPDFLSIHPRFLPSTLRCFFYQIATALASLHDGGIVHGDCKSENILYSQNGIQRILKLSDFGFACRRGGDKEYAEGTVDYLPPSNLVVLDEAIKDQEVSPLPYHVEAHMDCWAFGVIMYSCISSRTPFSTLKFEESEFQAAILAVYKKTSQISAHLLHQEALELCKKNYIKNLIQSPDRIHEIFSCIPERVKAIINQRDPKGIFSDLILQCLNPNDATRINIHGILAALSLSPYLPVEYR